MDATVAAVKHEHTRTGTSVEHLKRAFIDSLIYDQARRPERATTLDYYSAIASSIRDRLTQRWVNTIQAHSQADVRIVCYFSAEYLLGPHLGNNLLNLGIEAPVSQAMRELRLNEQEIIDTEEGQAWAMAV